MEPDANEPKATHVAPTIGRIVNYKIYENDLTMMGNGVRAGDMLPAIVVRVWTPGSTTVNLQVLTDGPVMVWKSSVSMGDIPGQWSWPVY
jgi:hypothetical protein